MIEPNWTPGPWEVSERTYSTHNSPTRYWETTVFAKSGEAVAVALGASEEESRANARVIANLHANVHQLHKALADAVKHIEEFWGRAEVGTA